MLSELQINNKITQVESLLPADYAHVLKGITIARDLRIYLERVFDRNFAYTTDYNYADTLFGASQLNRRIYGDCLNITAVIKLMLDRAGIPNVFLLRHNDRHPKLYLELNGMFLCVESTRIVNKFLVSEFGQTIVDEILSVSIKDEDIYNRSLSNLTYNNGGLDTKPILVSNIELSLGKYGSIDPRFFSSVDFLIFCDIHSVILSLRSGSQTNNLASRFNLSEDEIVDQVLQSYHELCRKYNISSYSRNFIHLFASYPHKLGLEG